jgi:hypothetical protein
LVSIDDSLWPLLVVKFSGSTSTQEFESYLNRMTDYLNRGEKLVSIFESTEMKDSPMEHRQLQIEWVQKNDALLRERMLGTAFIIASPVVRLAMNVIQLLSKPPHPSTVSPTKEAALEWAADRFRDGGESLASLRIRTQHGLLVKRAAAK